MIIPYLPAIAIAALLLLAVPVYLPRFALGFSIAILGLAVFFFVKPPPPVDKPNWGLDDPIGVIIMLYDALWIGTALISRRRDRHDHEPSGERAPVIDQRGLDQVRGAPAM